MAIVTFCDNCRREKNWPKPSFRTTTAECDFCGSWDAYRKAKRNPRTGETEVQTVKLNNFEQDARFLPGMPQETRLQEPLA
jgi:hypothetical protein